MDIQFILLALVILSINSVGSVGSIASISFISFVRSISYTNLKLVKFSGTLVSVRCSEFGIRDSI